MLTCFVDQCSNDIRDCTVWIGGSDKSKETQFIWSKSKNKITFTKWLSNNPDDYKGNEDCIETTLLGSGMTFHVISTPISFVKKI